VQARINNAVYSAVYEATAEAELLLARDDVGWMALTGGGVVPEKARRETVNSARVFGVYDGLSKEIINLYVNFGVGTGITWHMPEDNTEALKVLTAFWNDPDNAVVFSMQGQRGTGRDLLTDGELPFVLFTGDGAGQVKVRPMDPLQIIDIATNPEDVYDETHIVRRYTPRGQSQPKTVIYRTINNPDDNPGVDQDGKEVTASPGTDDAVVYLMRLDTVVGRGNSLLTPVIEWAKAHREFMIARIAIEQQLAKYVRDVEVKGGAGAVSAEAARMEARLAARSESNQEKASSYVHNPGLKVTPTSQETGASAAQVDGGMILQRVGAGAGVYPIYLGAGESFRLATATAMETPMLRTFQAFQALINDMYKTIFKFVLDDTNVADDKQAVDIDKREIFPQDVEKALKGVETTVNAFPDLAFSEELQKVALGLAGVSDVDTAIENLKDQVKSGVNESAAGMLLAAIKEVRESRNTGGGNDG
jgi:hypothetical protein